MSPLRISPARFAGASDLRKEVRRCTGGFDHLKFTTKIYAHVCHHVSIYLSG